MSSVAFSTVVIVDGVGSQPTSSQTFPTSFKYISEAVNEIGIRNNLTSPVEIKVVVPTLEEPNAIFFNTPYSITLSGNEGTGTHLKLSDNGLGIGRGFTSTGIAIVQKTNQTTKIRDFTFTPTQGQAGSINTAMVYIYNEFSDTTNSTVEFNRCLFTSLVTTNIPDQKIPVTNPFIHAVNFDTKESRRGELRSFDGGAQLNVIELDQKTVPTAESNVTVNFTDSIITHIVSASGGAKGGGIGIRRKSNWTVNVSGAVFSYLDGSGIRCAQTNLTDSKTYLNIKGSATNPNIFYKNGWMENGSDQAVSSGIIYESSQLNVEHSYFLENFASGLIKSSGAGNVEIKSSVFANNQFDLIPTNGNPPNVSQAANLKLSFSGNGGNVNISNSTIFNCHGANGRSLYLSGSNLPLNINFSNIVFSGQGDFVTLDAMSQNSIYTEQNCAIVQQGAYAMLSNNPIELPPLIEKIINYRVTADPMFESSTFNPSFNATNEVTGLQNYLKPSSPAYLANRETGAASVSGHHFQSPKAEITEYERY